MCNGIVDCLDASDEIGCQNINWRLHNTLNMTVTEGRVQLQFQNKWTDVCVDGLRDRGLDRLCGKLNMG